MQPGTLCPLLKLKLSSVYRTTKLAFFEFAWENPPLLPGQPGRAAKTALDTNTPA